MSSPNDEPLEEESEGRQRSASRHTLGTRLREARVGLAPLYLAIAFALGVGAGYLRWGYAPIRATPLAAVTPTAQAEDTEQPTFPDSYTLPVSFGDVGPQLLAAGAIDPAKFTQLYAEEGQPLTDDQLSALTTGSSDRIAITPYNARFLLNFFWALGLANKNAILDEGAMVQYGGRDKIGSFASTAGWTLGSKLAADLYSSVPILALTAEQQARVAEVAGAVYRPCCGNPTSFPDCNHGMAMLGLLELMASQGTTVDQMFDAAKYVNAFWFPEQTVELVTFFQAKEGIKSFAQIDARRLVSGDFSSATGFGTIHEQLQQEGLLKQAPGGGNNCGV